MKLEHSLTPYTKINSKWIKDLNLKTGYYKTLRGRHRQNTDINHSKIFFDPSPRSKENKNKNQQMGPNQT